MPWADCVFQDWDDCIWQDWEDCVWDKFEMQDRIAGTRTVRQFPAEGSGNFRRPYLEGNPSYVEDNQRYPDAAIANALMKATGEVQPHMTFKQPYRYETLQKMKYRNEPAFPHEETRIPETPMDIIDEAAKTEEAAKRAKTGLEWKWIRYFDFSKWIPNSVGGILPTGGIWFDNRWLPEADASGDYFIILEVTGNWFRNFRPLKMRVDSDGTGFQYISLFDDISTLNAIITIDDYTALTETTIPWAGRDINGIGFAWSAAQLPQPPEPTAVTNIEFYQQVEKGTYLTSDERMPRKQISPGLGKVAFPDPSPIRDSVRLPRRGNLRTTR